MMIVWWCLCYWCVWRYSCGARAAHSFPRALPRGRGGAGGAAEGRRVFGALAGDTAAAARCEGAAPAALLDALGTVRCSAAALAPRWLLTAAHCVRPHVAYVRYHAHAAPGLRKHRLAVDALYRHPEYRVEQRRAGGGGGVEVTLLHHDLGLVRTVAGAAAPAAPPPHHAHPAHAAHAAAPLQAALTALRRYRPEFMSGEEVHVCGYGVSEAWGAGERLGSATLRLCGCERAAAAWRHCSCATGLPARPGGVCAGDSGGPVLYQGQQIGVISMGPHECSSAAAAAAAEGATCVLTTLHRYVDMMNATVLQAARAGNGSGEEYGVLRMVAVQRGAAPAPRAAPPLLLLAVATRAGGTNQ